jgi:LysR family transcriptional regulator, flagellar master operon regulator
MGVELPDPSIHAELGTAANLAEARAGGAMQICLTYSPTLGLGLSVEKVMEGTLLLVTPWRDPKLDRLQGRYAFVDWGPEFRDLHQAPRVDFGQPALTALTPAMGSAAAPFLVVQNLAAYLPQRVCAPLIAAGKRHKVAHSTSFTQVPWSVWRDDLEADLADVARRTLLEVAAETVEEPGRTAE